MRQRDPIPKPILACTLACTLACALAFGETPSDSLAANPTPEPAADSTAHRSDSTVPAAPAADLLPPPAPKARAEAPAARPRPRTLTLLLDFADMNAQYRTNQRHFRSDNRQTNYCCLDVAWQPVSLADEHLRVGPSMNFGGWLQKMDQGPATSFNDLTLGGSLLAKWAPRGSGPWARTDLGLSLLSVTRRTTGWDYGVGAALRAGWLLSSGGFDLLVGMGVDTRSYQNLDVKPITAATFFAGVGL